MSTTRDTVQRNMPPKLPNVSDYEFYAASNFTTAMGPADWRIYWVSGNQEGWLLRFTGPDAEVKAKAVAAILNADM